MIPCKEYWDAPNMKEARAKIYNESDGKTWDGQTEAVMPILLNDMVLKNLPRPPILSVALEIGCGIGRLLKPMAKEFAEVYGIDYSETMIAYAHEYLDGDMDVVLRYCDGQTIPVDDGEIDFVYSMIVFQHLQTRENVQKYLSEAFRILRPGGIVRIQTYCGTPPRQPDAVWGYYYTSLAMFVNEFIFAGFDVIQAQEGVWHEGHLWVTARKPVNR